MNINKIEKKIDILKESIVKHNQQISDYKSLIKTLTSEKKTLLKMISAEKKKVKVEKSPVQPKTNMNDIYANRLGKAIDLHYFYTIKYKSNTDIDYVKLYHTSKDTANDLYELYRDNEDAFQQRRNDLSEILEIYWAFIPENTWPKKAHTLVEYMTLMDVMILFAKNQNTENSDIDVAKFKKGFAEYKKFRRSFEGFKKHFGKKGQEYDGEAMQRLSSLAVPVTKLSVDVLKMKIPEFTVAYQTFIPTK